MSQIQLQVKPRRVRCSASCEPPPFRFEALGSEARASTRPALVRSPLLLVARSVLLVGLAIDAAFFLAGLTTWCAVHLVLWSYAFELGPAADCFGLPCPAWMTERVLVGCAALTLVTLVGAVLLRRLGHRATGTVLLLLLTFDVAALLLMAVGVAG